VTCDRLVVFSGTPVSSTNKTDRHDITEILLKVALNSINQTTMLVRSMNQLFCKTDSNNITEILLKVALNPITPKRIWM
jgi:hypothetical protein